MQVTAKKRSNAFRKTPGERIFDFINGFILVLLCIVTLYPMWYVIVASFTENSYLVAHPGTILWPVGFTVGSYELAFTHPLLVSGYLNILFVLVVSLPINILLTLFCGYFLASKNVMFKKPVLGIIMFTMFFSGGMIPTYLNVRSLGLYNSLWALILPGAVSAYNMILLLNFFKTIPSELEEAALIDGAGHWRILWGLYVPCSLPAIATLTLFFVVGHWNEWFSAQIYLNRTEQYPLQSYLQVLLTQSKNTQNLSLKELEELAKVNNRTFNSAQIVLSTLPVLLVYPFLQRYFVTGLTLGSVKG